MLSTGIPAWDGAYEAVACLKKTPARATYLLERRGDARRFIGKTAAGEQAALLEGEYALLRSLPGQGGFETLELGGDSERRALLRDFVPGQTLEQLVRREGTLDPAEAAALALKLCRALEALHALTPPVIHRDLKPENIVLTPAGRVRLIDMEAARRYKPGQESDTVLLGTRGYAAPEQFGHGQTDVRTDIYAVGRVLAYLLTGSPDTPPALRGRDRALGRVTERCCAYDPARRYAGTAQLARALERYLARRAIPIRPLAAAACAGLLVCAAVFWGGYQLGLRAPAPAAAAAETASGWDPFLWKEDVTQIVRLAGEQDWPALAQACEELVTGLQADPMIAAVEPVAFWELDEAGLADYYGSRQGYEYIADRMAYKDGLAVSRLGSYEAAMPAFALQLQRRIDYVSTDDTGQTQVSTLHALIAEGDERNIDGCVIEILEELCGALEQTPAP